MARVPAENDSKFRYEPSPDDLNLFEKAIGKCVMVERPPGDQPAQCLTPRIHGLSDLDGDGRTEYWYELFRYHCDGIRVIEPYGGEENELLSFAFCD